MRVTKKATKGVHAGSGLGLGLGSGLGLGLGLGVGVGVGLGVGVGVGLALALALALALPLTSGFSSPRASAKMRTRPGMAPRITVWKETERSVSPAFDAPMSSAVITPGRGQG